MDFMTLIYSLLPIVASSSDEGGGAEFLPLLLLLSGFIFYFYIISRYRNADKRHAHEKETASQIANLAVYDNLEKNMKGLKNATMTGANHTRVEGALNTGSGSKLVDSVGKITGG